MIPAIIQIATVLGAALVAEGIETVQLASAVLALGCELGQGYLYSPPIPAASFERFLGAGPIAPIGAHRAPSTAVEGVASTT